MTLEALQVGIYAEGEDRQGWLRVLQQEGLPHQLITAATGPLTVFGAQLPTWVEQYLVAGGIAVISGAPEAPGLLPPSVLAVIHRFTPPDGGTSCYAPTLARLFAGPGQGECRLHEDRKVRHGNDLDRFPVVLTQAIGAGTVVYSGIPLARLLVAGGDSLRRFSPYTEISERVASIDKASVAETLVWMLQQAFRHAGLPYARPVRYPGGARSVFIFRVDVDGAFGDRTRRLAEVAAHHGVPASFFFNGARCEADPGALDVDAWPGAAEIAQHGYIHDVFPDMETNLDNLQRGAAWVAHRLGQEAQAFVAPRGLWNAALDAAVARLGYPYSSDFALDFDSLPFRTPAGILQIPVHPYSPERAFVYMEEHGLPTPTPESICSYYMSVLQHQAHHERPVHLYGHPERLGALAEQVLPPLFDRARAAGLPTLNLAQFCAWWMRRERVAMQLAVDRTTGEVHISCARSAQVPLEFWDGMQQRRIDLADQAVTVAAATGPVTLAPRRTTGGRTE
jgi:peptidoglycan/xylan/chitin deacetylase (PgdA/CDA1 family)